jgi:hypothetical protein
LTGWRAPTGGSRSGGACLRCSRMFPFRRWVCRPGFAVHGCGLRV